MKKLLFILILLSPIISFCQEVNFPVDKQTNKIVYTEVVENKNDKVTNYKKALEWFARTFKSSNDVIQIKDETEGKIVGKWSIDLGGSSGYVSVNIIILCKDDRYKYIFTDLRFQGSGSFKSWDLEENPSIWDVNMAKRSIKYTKETANTNILEAIKDLKLYIGSENYRTDF